METDRGLRCVFSAPPHKGEVCDLSDPSMPNQLLGLSGEADGQVYRFGDRRAQADMGEDYSKPGSLLEISYIGASLEGTWKT